MDVTNQKTKIIPISGNPREDKTIKLKNLKPNQASLLRSTLAGVSGISLGALLMNFIPKPNGEGELNDIVDETGETMEVPVNSNASFADSVSDGMSFSDAFKEAREQIGPGGLFEWHGRTYSTFHENEWESAPVEIKMDSYNVIEENHEDADIVDESDILDILNDEYSEIEEIDIVNDTEDMIINENPDASEILHIIDDSSDEADFDDPLHA
jgi:hypothetical protein